MASTPHWQTVLTRAWLTRGWLAIALWPLSTVYGALVRLRHWLYRIGALRSHRLPVPVVVVGNVVAGGAGKTPTTLAIVRHLLATGHRPGVVSRGYGRQAAPNDNPVLVQTDSLASDVGDEPLLIHQHTGVPVVVARQRVAAARHLLATQPDTTVIVCDDGLQHLALAADLSIAVFDDRGVGNGWLLPAGPLRERWPCNGGRHIDAVLRTHSGDLPAPLAVPAGIAAFDAHRALADTATDAWGRHLPLPMLAAHTAATPALALAGIARPQAFFDMLQAQGVLLADTWALADHQAFDNNFCSKLLNEYERKSLFLTEKDAVKLLPLLRQHPQWPSRAPAESSPHGIWVVGLTLTPAPALFPWLDARLSSAHGHQTA